MGNYRKIAFAAAASTVTTLVLAGISVLATPRDAPGSAALAAAAAPARTAETNALAGAPVVHLAPITVSASRSEVLAQIAREEALASAADAVSPAAAAAEATPRVYAANAAWQ